MSEFTVAVVVPCHNEERTIASVIQGFLSSLPGCTVFVADNNSTDQTAEAARSAGAVVIREQRAGKGFAIRRLFADVDADCYVMVDGDDTYDPAAAAAMVSLVRDQGVDMVNAARDSQDEEAAYRRGHVLGNTILTWIFSQLFGLQLKDTLSGYRALSRRFVKSFPTGASGFEIETELNAHAAVLGLPTAEVTAPYRSRPEGSESKLNTYRDGFHILRRNLRLFRDARPNLAFLLLSLPWLLAALLLMGIALAGYLESGLVERFPSLIAGAAFLVVAVLLLTVGAIMERTARNRVEAARLFYLSYPGPINAGRSRDSVQQEKWRSSN